jgi:hypothetical protein
MVDLERAADVLGAMLAAIDEDVLDLQLGNVAQGAGYGDAARLCHGLDARGDIDPVAEYGLGLLVDDDLAEVQADPKHQAPVLIEHVVEAGHALLDVDRRRHRGHRGLEFGQDGIAHDIHYRPSTGFDRRAPDLVLDRFEVVHGAVLRAFHQAHEAGEICVQDGGEPAAMDRHR